VATRTVEYPPVNPGKRQVIARRMNEAHDEMTATMKEGGDNVGPASREAGRPARFEATVIKVQRRPCWSFVVEVEAAEFASVQPGQGLSAGLGWFLVSGTRTGNTSVRFRGFGHPKLAVGERIVIRAEPVRPSRKPAKA
jgi:hypothetical protein